MADPRDVLGFYSLTDLVNKVKSPNAFLQNMLYSDHRSMPTENFEMGIKIGGRDVAPFIRKGGQSVLVGGYTQKSVMISPANIALKRPFSPEVMFFRRPGQDGIYVNGAADLERVASQALADDVQRMGDMTVNAIEYLAAQSLTGIISYQAVDMENFHVDFLRDSANNVSPVAVWTNQSTSDVLQDIKNVKKLVADAEGLPVTDAICGVTAANALLANTKVLAALQFSQTNVLAGDMTKVEQYTADGALYLGKIGGVRFWEYGRSTVLPDGTTAQLIADAKVHFVANVPGAEFRLMFGAIAEMIGEKPLLYVGERFSKSFAENDPPQLFQTLKSRPMPVLRKPNATASMTVV